MRSESKIHRIRMLFVLFVCIATLLAIRIFHVMVISGDELRSKADDNRFFHKYFSPPRGIIFDRNDNPLVSNVVLYAKIIGDPKSLHPKVEPIDEHQALELLISNPETVVTLQKRFYPFGNALSHVVGYLGFPAEGDQSILNERVGKSGLELTLNSQLRGEVGSHEYEINAKGSLTRLIKTIEPTYGKDLKISLDAELSVQSSQLLEGKKGAVIVSEIETSQIIVMVSGPTYDPLNLADSLEDSNKPLLNRALQPYPPGSVFKMMTSLAALKMGKLDADRLINDEGEIKVGEAVFRNWYFTSYGKTEGEINLVKALSRSNDIFFYKIASEIGPDQIAAMANAFHLGQKTGVELSGEQAGLTPTPSWKENKIGEKWYLGDTYHMGIGQGYLLVTPLQVNAMTAALARGGVWCRPTLLQGTPICEDLGIDKDHLKLISLGMRDACSSGGTAFPFFEHNSKVEEAQKVVCKTGTAEFGPRDEKGHRPTHAWFTMYYPMEKPKIAITVLLESSQGQVFLEGSGDAAPIAKTIWELWLASNK